MNNITTENYYKIINQLPRGYLKQIVKQIADNHKMTLGQLSAVSNIPETTLNGSSNRTLNYYQLKTLANFEKMTIEQLLSNTQNETKYIIQTNIINDEYTAYEKLLITTNVTPDMIQNYFDHLVKIKNTTKVKIADEIKESKHLLSRLKNKFYDYSIMNKISKYFNMNIDEFFDKAYEYKIRTTINNIGFNKIEQYINHQLEKNNVTKKQFLEKSNLTEYQYSALRNKNWNISILKNITKYFNLSIEEFINQLINQETKKSNNEQKLSLSNEEYFKKQLKKIMNERNINVQELAHLTGVTESTIRRWIGNTFYLPTQKNLKLLATKLGVDYNYFLLPATQNKFSNEEILYIKKGQIYKNILTILEKQNKTLQWLSDETNIPYSTLNRWNKRKPTDLNRLKNIANTLNVDLKELLSVKNEEKKIQKPQNKIDKTLYPNLEPGQIYKNILKYAKLRNISINKLSQYTDVSRQTISSWYRFKWPKNTDALFQIAEKLNIDITQLFEPIKKDESLNSLNVGALYQNIKNHCERKNISLTQLAEQTNISIKTINGWATRKEPASFATVEQIAKALEISPNELYKNLTSEKFNINVPSIVINTKMLYEKIQKHIRNKSDFEKAFIQHQIDIAVKKIQQKQMTENFNEVK